MSSNSLHERHMDLFRSKSRVSAPILKVLTKLRKEDLDMLLINIIHRMLLPKPPFL
jgi:hypothetical protein